MLLEIQCEKFAETREDAGKIRFRRGLNVVCGGNAGDNSIGKTSFLNAVNFAFGAKDYPTADVLKEVGHHVVNFAFEFEDGVHRFRRSTKTKEIVQRCDENYGVVGQMSIKEFCDFLAGKYGLPSAIPLRAALGAYLRIYDRTKQPSYDPLRSHAKQRDEACITDLVKLFGRYGAVEAAIQKKKEATDRKQAYGLAGKYHFVQNITKRDKKRNDTALLKLEAELREMQNTYGGELSNLAEKAHEMTDAVKSKIAELMRKRRRLRTHLALVEQNVEEMPSGTEERFDDLKEFFPDVALRKVQEVEAFHRGLKEVLAPELACARNELKHQLDVVENDILLLKEREIGISRDSGVAKEMLREYAEKTEKIRRLQEENKSFETSEQVKEDERKTRQECGTALKAVCTPIADEINGSVKESNVYICGASASAPRFSAEDAPKYRYENAKDEGAGATDRGILQFHLAVLKLTKLPILIEDSDNFKNIENQYVLKLLELFAREDKQIFVALDRAGHYSDDRKEPAVISDNVVLRLSKGNELFGHAWNREEKP